MALNFEDSLKDKVCLITGGTKGIGREVAKELSRYGMKLAVAARSEKELAETVDELRRNGSDAIGVQTDVSSLSQIRSMVEEVVMKFETIDILVNCAGINIPTKALDITEEIWDQALILKERFSVLKKSPKS